ncbi:MAG: Gfo/Idh/MocA family protein [Aeoliella sp.]
MKSRTTRRSFLQTSAVLSCGYWISGQAQAQTSRSPNEKLNIAIIGVNNRGRANTGGVKSENIVVLCDIDDQYLDAAAGQFPQADRMNDWRDVCERKDVDAVVISTADHHHALAAVKAMRCGKHVYCEKPLAHTVEEARAVRDAFKQSNVATQMGTQIHATDNYRRVVELVQSGAIGPVREAHVWCGRSSGKVGPLPATPEIPPHLHWDVWLGPASDRPFNAGYLPGNLCWNRWWDFGNGVLGDMGSHLIDLPFWALDLKHPEKVYADGPPVDAYANPPWMIVNWDHPATDQRPAVKVSWYHHKKRPPSPTGIDLSTWGIGVMFVGEKGQLVADYDRRVLLPAKEYEGFEPPEPTIASSLGHYREWIHAAKTGEPTLCNFEYSGALIEHNLLGNVAYRVGEGLTWDADKFEAVGNPNAEQFIKKEYRAGWDTLHV